jgi:hypothetical protein
VVVVYGLDLRPGDAVGVLKYGVMSAAGALVLERVIRG